MKKLNLLWVFNTVNKSTFTVVLALIVVVLSNSKAFAWSPAGGEESAYFNQYVTEQLVYDPPDPVYNEWGDQVGWSGPTYEQQWNAEYNRRIQEGNNAANQRRNTINNSANQTRGLTNSVQRNGTLNSSALNASAQSENAARQRVARAKSQAVDGPTLQETSRMSNTNTAGGRLDANKDGVISASERKAALYTRVSMKSEQFLDERKIDLNGDGDLSNAESKSSLRAAAGVNGLDHNQMINDLKNESNYQTPAVNSSSTYVDSRGNVKSVASLNNTQERSQQLANTSTQLAATQNTDPATRNDLYANVPNSSTTSYYVRTGGTWGKTHSGSKTHEVGGAITRKQVSFGHELNNAGR